MSAPVVGVRYRDALSAPQVVYFVEMPGAPVGFRFVKIGKTSERVGTSKRLCTLQTAVPHDLRLLGEIHERWFGREGQETFWHHVFREWHHSREWFLIPEIEITKLLALLDDRKLRHDRVVGAITRDAAAA